MSATLRPYLPTDAPRLADLFDLSIEDLAAEDYNPDQRAAWADAASDLGAFAEALGKALTLVVDSPDGPIGFGALENNSLVSMLYVHPDHARRGVATLIMNALEKLAEARGTVAIKVDASDTAEPFFAGRGYSPLQRNTVMRAGEWLGNTTMEKRLAPRAAGGRAP